MLTLHKAIKPAGLVDGPLTYSLFATDAGLFCIKVGPAARELKEIHVKGIINEILAKLIFNKVEARVAKKVAAAEAKLDVNNLEAHAREKGSAFYTKVQLSNMEVSSNKLGHPLLRFSVDGKAHEFFFRNASQEAVESFAKALKK